MAAAAVAGRPPLAAVASPIPRHRDGRRHARAHDRADYRGPQHRQLVVVASDAWCDEPDRLSVIWFGSGVKPGGVGSVRPACPTDLDDLERAATTLQGVAGVQEGDVRVAAGNLAPAVSGSDGSPRSLRRIGVRLAAGRAFTAEEDQPPSAQVAVISAGLAAERSAVQPALGQRVVLNGRPSVIGVLPPEFVGITPAGRWTSGIPPRPTAT